MAGFSEYKTSKATLGSSAGDSNGLKFATGINTADSLRADSIGTALATFASIIGDSHATEWIDSGYGVVTIDEKGTYTNGDSISGGGAQKTEPTLTLGEFSYTGYYYSAAITYDGDGTLAAVATNNTAGKLATTFINDNSLFVSLQSGDAFTGYLVATEGQNYAEKVISYTKA